MRRNILILLLALLPGLPALAETVTLEPGRDATLIEDPDGARADGSSPLLFVGRTNQMQNGIRRSLLYFDVAAALPANALIESASLTLSASTNNPESRELRLHRVLSNWGEGPSSAGSGGGAPSQPGDATWIHTFYDFDFWSHAGGKFRGVASARQQVAGTGVYTWHSTNHLVQDVRHWNTAPRRNFGWILIGDETTRQTSKRIASRENPDPALRPLLEITYRLPGKPGGRRSVHPK